MERTLTDLVALAKVLYQEEQKAFHAAMEEDTDRSVTSQMSSHALHSLVRVQPDWVRRSGLSGRR